MKRYKEWTFVSYPGLLGIQKDLPDGRFRKKFVRVEDDSEYSYKLMKTKIKAAGGAEGLYDLMVRCIDKHLGECLVEKILEYAFNEMREVYR